MILDFLDCFFILMIIVIFGLIVHIETELKQVKTMMEEHVRFDQKLSKKALDD